MTSDAGSRSRDPATAVVACIALTIAVAIVLVAAFDPDVQTLEADELVARSDDARAFLVADFLFVAVYAVALPLAIRRCADRLPGWMLLGAPLLAAGGLVDAAENTLLLSATGAVAEGRVDAAHALAAPKVALFVVGAVLALLAAWRASRPR